MSGHVGLSDTNRHEVKRVDLDELLGIVDAEIVDEPWPGYVSPLQGYADADDPWLHGGVVTDPAEVEQIRARVAAFDRPRRRWWRR